MSKTITVYSTATCGYCHMLIEWLDKNQFPYTVKRVDQDQEAAREMVLKSGQMGVPYTVIIKDDGSEQGVLGFDVERLKTSLL